MPVSFNRELLSRLSPETLITINRFRKITIILSIIGSCINAFIYYVVTYVGFIFTSEGHYFNYIFKQNLNLLSYYLNWVPIFIASFCTFLLLYLSKFILNPKFSEMGIKEPERPKGMEDILKQYNSTVMYRIIIQLLIIGGNIANINYFPRYTQLFFPFIGCNPLTGICVITTQVLFQYIFIMTSILLILIGLYFLVIFIDRKESMMISLILNPEIEEIKRKRLEEKRKWINMSVEEKKKVKIEQLREKHQQKLENKKKSKEDKFEEQWKEEQFGKKGYKIIKKDEKEDIKTSKEKKRERKAKPEKDEFDFT